MLRKDLSDKEKEEHKFKNNEESVSSQICLLQSKYERLEKQHEFYKKELKAKEDKSSSLMENLKALGERNQAIEKELKHASSNMDRHIHRET